MRSRLQISICLNISMPKCEIVVSRRIIPLLQQKLRWLQIKFQQSVLRNLLTLHVQFFSSEGISHICLDGPCRKYNIPDLKFWICIWQEPRKAQHQSNSKLAEILISCTHEFLLLIPNIVVIWSRSQHFCIAEDT